ncbi:hypothetical protein AQI95_14760 [Streptomyces yokosukanensis]|uniref:Uncharacterized protein n=1 Tax=Streptomyces yokosukanensis TaxID=67386 RepID=A0A101P7H3_9ACTN|nr:hypothetical protein [Streptomyces yokosukanensis]KUN06340.1 hypothetical protein AQI95_14760 [Streptomyces yokosukanensis]
MFGQIFKYATKLRTSARVQPTDVRERRTHNLFEAAATYIAARAENDQERIEEATTWVPADALSFGVSELARRAVVALARERDVSPTVVARDLLGLPTD